MAGRRNFKWDITKAAGNLAKRGVSFDYAIRVFSDAQVADIDAMRPSEPEVRRKAIGMLEG